MAAEEGGGNEEQEYWNRRQREAQEYVRYEERIIPQEITERLLKLLVRKVKIRIPPTTNSGS